MKRDLVVISWDGKSRPHEAVDFDQKARFDLLTFDYSGRAGRLPAGAPNAQLLSRPTECKGQIYLEVARHLQSCAAQYEYVGLIDDDIIIKVSGINHLLHVARLLKLDSFAPALTHDSGYTYKHTLRMENILLHWVPWVEVMMPFYRQPLFMAPSAQYGISISGWGVDKYLLPLFQKITGMNRAAVINAVAATHMRAATSGKKIYSNGRTAEDEVAVVGQWCLDFIAECHPHLADTDWYRSTFKVALERQAARRSVRDEGRPA